MNTTGRLPAVLLVCRKMPVRCTVTVCRRQAQVDTIGIVQHVELQPAGHRRWQQEGTESIFVLHHPQTILVKIDDNDKDIGLGPGIFVVVAKQLYEPFITEVGLTDERCSRARLLRSDKSTSQSIFCNDPCRPVLQSTCQNFQHEYNGTLAGG